MEDIHEIMKLFVFPIIFLGVVLFGATLVVAGIADYLGFPQLRELITATLHLVF